MIPNKMNEVFRKLVNSTMRCIGEIWHVSEIENKIRHFRSSNRKLRKFSLTSMENATRNEDYLIQSIWMIVYVFLHVVLQCKILQLFVIVQVFCIAPRQLRNWGSDSNFEGTRTSLALAARKGRIFSWRDIKDETKVTSSLFKYSQSPLSQRAVVLFASLSLGRRRKTSAILIKTTRRSKLLPAAR